MRNKKNKSYIITCHLFPMSTFSNDLLKLLATTSCFTATKSEGSNKNKRITNLHYSTIWSSALDKTIFVFYVILVQIRCIFPEQLMAVWIVVVSVCSYVQIQGRRLIKMSVGTGTRKKRRGRHKQRTSCLGKSKMQVLSL